MNRRFHLLQVLPLFLLMTGAKAEEIPFAIETDRPNIVRSPFSEKYLIDVSDFKPGQAVLDPFTKKKMRVPLNMGKASVAPEPAPPAPKPAPSIPEPAKPAPPLSKPAPRAAPPAPKPEPQVRRPEIVRKTEANKAVAKTPQKAPAPAPAPAPIPQEQAKALIAKTLKGYIISGALNNPMASVAFYETPVTQYFGRTNVSEDALLKDRRNHIRAWPSRKYELLEKPSITANADGTFEALVVFSYRVSNGEKSRKGTARSLIKLRQAKTGSSYLIYSVAEKKI